MNCSTSIWIMLVLVGGSIRLHGQTFEISGYVFDSLSGAPIASAHLFVSQSTLGTVSGYSGEFSLRIPVTNSDEYLTVSCIGYKSKKLPIDRMTHQGTILVLTPASTILNEVVIVDELDSGRYLLNEAIRAIARNYPKKKHILEGFYREISVKDTFYTRLIEASILVQEIGYSRNNFDKENLNISKSRIQIVELRQSDDSRTYDKMGSVYNYLFGEKNDMYEILEDNYIRFLGTRSPHFLSSNFLDDYDIYLAGVSEYDGHPVFEIVVESKGSAFFKREVRFYIKKTDYAFLKIENALILSATDDKMKRKAIDGKYFYQSEIHYRRLGEHYTPFVIHTRKYASNTNPLVSDQQGGSSLQYMDLIFLLTGFQESGFDRIKTKEQGDPEGDISKIKWPYNKEFWDNYNVPKLNPLNAKILNHLERTRSLERQFESR